MAELIADDIDWNLYAEITEARSKVLPASSWRERILQWRLGGGKKGAVMPWTKTHGLIEFRDSELTVWAGENGSGKSTTLGNVFLAFMGAGDRCCIASFEMRPEITLSRMARQAAQCERYTDEFEDHFLSWTDDKLWLYDQLGTVHPDRMLAVARYCGQELKINHLAIDSMMKCVRGEDDYNGQKDFVDALTAICRDTGMHIHLVHHMRKPAGDGGSPQGKYGMKGSGAISDLADNVIVVWRDQKKLEAIKAKDDYDDAKPDAKLLIEKQRNGSFEGSIALWLDPDSLQLTPNSDRRPVQFVESPADRLRSAVRSTVIESDPAFAAMAGERA